MYVLVFRRGSVGCNNTLFLLRILQEKLTCLYEPLGGRTRVVSLDAQSTCTINHHTDCSNGDRLLAEKGRLSVGTRALGHDTYRMTFGETAEHE